jgi:hypothetical protein
MKPRSIARAHIPIRPIAEPGQNPHARSRSSLSTYRTLCATALDLIRESSPVGVYGRVILTAWVPLMAKSTCGASLTNIVTPYVLR